MLDAASTALRENFNGRTVLNRSPYAAPERQGRSLGWHSKVVAVACLPGGLDGLEHSATRT